MVNRKLILGNKVIGGLPKQKPEKTARRRDITLHNVLVEEYLTMTVYGRYTDDPDFIDLEPEQVIASCTVHVMPTITPERAEWSRIDGPEEVRILPARYMLATRVDCELPLALRSYRPGHRQNLPIQPARIKPGDMLTVVVPKPLIDFK